MYLQKMNDGMDGGNSEGMGGGNMGNNMGGRGGMRGRGRGGPGGLGGDRGNMMNRSQDVSFKIFKKHFNLFIK